MAGKIDARLAELGIELPEAVAPVANYVPYVVVGNLIFTAGQITLVGTEMKYVGIVGEGFSIDEGYQAARLCGLNLLAHVRAACGGDLDRVKRVVKLGGFVRCPPDFVDQPKVINGRLGPDGGKYSATTGSTPASPSAPPRCRSARRSRSTPSSKSPEAR